MKVAAIQMPTVKDKIQNIRTAGTYIEKIKAENPDFVILPEMFCCPYQTENFPVYPAVSSDLFPESDIIGFFRKLCSGSGNLL